MTLHSFLVYDPPDIIRSRLYERLVNRRWRHESLVWIYNIFARGGTLGAPESISIEASLLADRGDHEEVLPPGAVRVLELRFYRAASGWTVEPSGFAEEVPAELLNALDWLRDAYNPHLAADKDGSAGGDAAPTRATEEDGAAPLAALFVATPSLEDITFSFYVDADLAAVVNALLAASQDLPVYEEESSGGTIAYGPLRPVTEYEWRRGAEQFDQFLELPTTIADKAGSPTQTGALTYVGIRRINDRRVKVTLTCRTRSQLSPAAGLLGRLELDYPGIVEQLRSKLREVSIPLTPRPSNASAEGGSTTCATWEADERHGEREQQASPVEPSESVAAGHRQRDRFGNPYKRDYIRTKVKDYRDAYKMLGSKEQAAKRVKDGSGVSIPRSTLDGWERHVARWEEEDASPTTLDDVTS